MPNSDQIASREMEQVEPDRCDYLSGNQDGSERMPSINEQERNRSGNITMIGSEVVGQKWPNGYDTAVSFALGHY